jgi:hypothetical protein
MTAKKVPSSYYEKLYGPGGNYRYDQYSESALYRIRKDMTASLIKIEKSKPRTPNNIAQRADDIRRLEASLRGVQACLDLRKADLKHTKRIKYRQVGGDDGYHYAVFLDGRMRYNGLTLTEAKYEKNLLLNKMRNGTL